MNELNRSTVYRARALFAIAAVLVSAGACAARSSNADGDSSLEVELAAVRSLLGAYSPGSLTVDSIYARSGEAPPSLTAETRPSDRHHALSDSVRLGVANGGGDTLRVRASAPDIRGRSAAISVTVDGRLANSHRRGGFYETVAFVLEKDGSRWVIRERKQLGVS